MHRLRPQNRQRTKATQASRASARNKKRDCILDTRKLGAIMSGYAIQQRSIYGSYTDSWPESDAALSVLQPKLHARTSAGFIRSSYVHSATDKIRRNCDGRFGGAWWTTEPPHAARCSYVGDSFHSNRYSSRDADMQQLRIHRISQRAQGGTSGSSWHPKTGGATLIWQTKSNPDNLNQMFLVR
jgi:hypothetical protein